MNRWFAEVKTVEELRKRYRELLKKYHPDNEMNIPVRRSRQSSVA